MRVLSFGEIVWDIIEGKEYLGGAPLNFIAYMSHLGAEASMLSRLGMDDLGKRAFDAVETHGVGTSFIQWDSAIGTGTVDVTLENGQPDYIINTDKAYDYISFEEAKPLLESTAFDILYFGTLVQRNATSAATLSSIIDQYRFKEIFYDVNLRKDCFSKSIIEASLKKCTILKLNEEELGVIGSYFFDGEMDIETFCNKISDTFQIHTIIVTAGKHGSYIFTKVAFVHIPVVPVEVVDAVGAGDSFSAAFLFKFYHKKDPIDAAKFANRIGAMVASSNGAIVAKNKVQETLHQYSQL
jgi:fructokinase